MINRKSSPVMIVIIAACLIMAWVDAVISPSYALKSVIKLILFLILPIGYYLLNRQAPLWSLFKFKTKGIALPLLIGIGVYIFIMGAYFILSPYFDFSNVTQMLERNIGVNKDNFVLVALYISFANSLLEEFFFRGFSFFTLKKEWNRRFAYLFSAGAFALYHIAMMTNWFTLPLFILLISGLFLSGLLFCWLNEKNENIYTSWMVHMFANFAINTIGFTLFGIL